MVDSSAFFQYSPAEKPRLRPERPFFSSGPCAKYPSWSWQDLEKAPLSRSHRSPEGLTLLHEVIEKTRSILSIPSDYRIAIIAGSTTGAMETALWSLLGPKGVDVFSWDVFGALWAHDVQHELHLSDTRFFSAPFGQLPDFSLTDPKRDIVFTWCGTTAGVWLPNAHWISDHQEGLVFCDVTSAVFAVDLPWSKLDATAFSWQKGLGGEAAHGMLVLSPKAVKRLYEYIPPWPMPRLFRLMRNGNLIEELFKGEVINTPSLLCAQDALNALNWIKLQGGMPEMLQRVEKNFQAIKEWVEKTPWIAFMAQALDISAKTAVCLKITDPTFQTLSTSDQWDFLHKMGQILAQEQVAFDVINHTLAPPSLRIWCGPMVETSDLQRLFLWLEWAISSVK